ncbi:hypothetical protein SPFM12_00034 [Salmonella phage SPFM12]|nr:hypothetical protein SPFM12_00034 [Salmonella phage SPFM12]
MNRNTPALEAIVKNTALPDYAKEYRTLFAIQDIVKMKQSEFDLLTGLSRGVFLNIERKKLELQEMRADAMHQTMIGMAKDINPDEQRQLQDRMVEDKLRDSITNQALMDRELGDVFSGVPKDVTKRIDKWSKSDQLDYQNYDPLKMQARQLGPTMKKYLPDAAAAAKDIYAHTKGELEKTERIILKGMPKPAADAYEGYQSAVNVARKSALSTIWPEGKRDQDFGEPPRPKDEKKRSPILSTPKRGKDGFDDIDLDRLDDWDESQPSLAFSLLSS